MMKYGTSLFLDYPTAQVVKAKIEEKP